MSNPAAKIFAVAPIILTSWMAFAGSLTKTVYDFDDTLISTTAYVQIYKSGSDAKTASADDIQRVSTAMWAEVRAELGKDGEYKEWTLNPEFSFQNFTGVPGTNAFLGHIKETLATKTAAQWQAPMWSDFVKQLNNNNTANDVFILTARSSMAADVLEGFQFLQTQGLIKNLIPGENIFAVSDPTLRLKSNPSLVLAKEKSEVSKSLIMQEMLDELESNAKLDSSQKATWAFYDDDYANFAKARDTLVPLASQRWPHVQITVGYVGVVRPNTPEHEVVVRPAALMTRMKKAN